jgi:hypothetical protein
MQYLFLRKDFHELVQKIREDMEIPSNGFDVPTEGKAEFPSVVHEKRSEIENYTISCGLLKHLPNMFLADSFYTELISEYVLFNDFHGGYKGKFALVSFEYYENMDGTDDQREPIELRIELPVSAKKDELIDFIKNNWHKFENTPGLKAKDKVRFKPRKNFFRDLRILNKYIEIESLSRQERRDRGIVYIDMEVQRVLREEGMEDVPDDGTIRALVNRLKDDIKDKNSFFKEIEDDPIEELPETKSSDIDDF